MNNSTDTNPAFLTFGKSKGGSLGSNTTVANGDYLGLIKFVGADGTDVATEAARIDCIVDGTPGSNDMPGRLIFSTTADGAASSTERLRITSAGNVGINETTPQQQLHVHDDTAYNGIFINGNGAPRITFARDTTTTVEWGVGVDGTDGSKFCIAQAGNTAKITLDTSGNFTAVGNVTDTSGNLRITPISAKSGNYTLVATDTGKTITRTGGNITVPQSMTVGMIVTIINNASSTVSIIQGSGATLRFTDSSTGTKTLAAYGVATVTYISASSAYITGTGLS
jgi:hypothetical protein